MYLSGLLSYKYTGYLNSMNNFFCFTYYYRTDEFSFMNLNKGKQLGFVAQDMEKVFPELVSEVSHPKTKGKTTEVEKYKAINYIGLIPVHAQAIQEQQTEISTVKEENKQLKQRNQQMIKQLDLFEKRLTELEKKK